MTTTQQPTLTDYPAFRLQAGDSIRYNNRRCSVLQVGLAYRFARGRHETSRSMTLLLLRAETGGRTIRATLEHCDTVRKYR